MYAVGLARLGRVSWAQGDYDLASLHRYTEVLKIAQETGINRSWRGVSVSCSLWRSPGQVFRKPIIHLKEYVSTWRESMKPRTSATRMVMLAELAHRWHRLETAARLFGAVEHFLPSFAVKMLSPAEIQNSESSALKCRMRWVKNLLIAHGWRARQMTLEQALDLVSDS